MESNYPGLKRPKRKLCYEMDKHSVPRQLPGILTLDDIDRMFDDIESSSSTQSLQIGETDVMPSQSLMSPVFEEKFPSGIFLEEQKGCIKTVTNGPSQNPKLDIDLEIPFNVDEIVKTSSPINPDSGEKLNADCIATPRCFDCIDESGEKHDKKVLTDETDGCEFDSPPTMIKITRKSGQKTKNEAPCSSKDVPQTLPALMKESQPPAPAKKPESDQNPEETSLPARKEMKNFLEILKLTARPKNYSKPLVKEPDPPAPREPEEDFFIVEDDVPLSVTIANKSLGKKKQKQSKTFVAEKTSLTDEKEITPEPEKSVERKSPAVQKIKKKNTNKKVVAVGHDERVLKSPRKLPASDLTKQQESKKKKSNKKLPVEEKKRLDLPGTKTKKTKLSVKPKTKTLMKKNLKKKKKTKQTVSFEESEENQTQLEPNTEEPRSPEVDGEECQPNTATPLNSDENLGKRKRKETGEWWMVSPQSKGEIQLPQTPPKKSKQRSKEQKAANVSPVKAKKVKMKQSKEKTLVEFSSEHSDEAGKTKKAKKIKKSPKRKKSAEKHSEGEEEMSGQAGKQQENNAFKFTHEDASTEPGTQIFKKIYNSDKKLKPPKTPRPQTEPEAGKRRRKPPGDWWTVGGVNNNLETSPSQAELQPKKSKLQQKIKKTKEKRAATTGSLKNDKVTDSSKPPDGAVTPHRITERPKTVKSSTPMSNGDNSFERLNPIAIGVRGADQGDMTHSRFDKAGGSGTAEQSRQEKSRYSTSTFLVLRSGPSSMVQPEDDESDDEVLPTSKVKPVLNPSDFCSPPLKPIVLQENDKNLINEWFKNLWFTDTTAVTAEHFDWHSYKGRALGLRVDVNTSSCCSGIILLGSYTKKPLWVDHTATTIFNLSSGSVNVSIDGRVSDFQPGETFMVNCGSAYSIHNRSSQPAILFFTRLAAESPD